jgi:hypothetical protein
MLCLCHPCGSMFPTFHQLSYNQNKSTHRQISALRSNLQSLWMPIKEDWMEYRLHGLSRSTEDIVSFLQASCKNLMRLTQLGPLAPSEWKISCIHILTSILIDIVSLLHFNSRIYTTSKYLLYSTLVLLAGTLSAEFSVLCQQLFAQRHTNVTSREVRRICMTSTLVNRRNSDGRIHV